MVDAQTFVATHGLWLVLGLVFAGGLGVPLPAPPILIAAGVLAGSGRLPLWAVLGGSLVALLAGDLIWYRLGRWRGQRILRLICQISLEPDSCVQRTEDLFASRQGTMLIVSKFLPGLKSVAPPLAGMLRMPLGRFALYDGAGTLLWVVAFTGLGYAFSGHVARIASAAWLGGWIGFAVGLALAIWLGWKYLGRWRFLRELRVARITPDELQAKLLAGEPVVVVDLRHPLAFGDGAKVLGALQMTPAELEHRHGEIPRDHDVVLYCNCPNEASAARMAMLLHERGVTRVRPLLGGLDAWQARGFPVEEISTPRLPLAPGSGSALFPTIRPS
jgi:membrane protein DedA with SNARE-associated domain/rhodanese-related sulfurtransferase